MQEYESKIAFPWYLQIKIQTRSLVIEFCTIFINSLLADYPKQTFHWRKPRNIHYTTLYISYIKRN